MATYMQLTDGGKYNSDNIEASFTPKKKIDLIKKSGGYFLAYDEDKRKYGSINIKTGKFSGDTHALIPLKEHLLKWNDINSYIPQCINVIEIISGIVSSVRSYPVYNKLEEETQSCNAEQVFLDLINEHEKPEVPFTDFEDFGEDYDDNRGYNLVLTWGTLNPVK